MESPSRYSPLFLQHMLQPRFLCKSGLPSFEWEGMGEVQGMTARTCLRVWVRVDSAGRIAQLEWQAMGMPQVIPSTSVLAEWVLNGGPDGKGLTLPEALAISPDQVAARLGGLPARKIHETVLGPKALREALGDRFKRRGLARQDEAGSALHQNTSQEELLCSCWSVKPSELRALAIGGLTFESAQEQLGVSTGCGSCLLEAQALFAWYQSEHWKAVLSPTRLDQEG